MVAPLRRILRAADLQSRDLARRTGLTMPQLVVLQAVDELGEVTTGRLSGEVSLSQATVTVVLDRLVARGLVERYRSPADRRIVHSRLTGEGSAALDRAGPVVHDGLVRAYQALAPDARERVVAALDWAATTLESATADIDET